jgi:hypothetical protein
LLACHLAFDLLVCSLACLLCFAFALLCESFSDGDISVEKKAGISAPWDKQQDDAFINVGLGRLRVCACCRSLA